MSVSYRAPLREIEFVLNDVLKAPERLSGMSATSWEEAQATFGAIADYVKNVAFPLNQKGDVEGCSFDPATGEVKTPAGFKAGYDKFAEMGLVGLLGSSAYGGFETPHYIVVAANEMLNANFSLACYPGLTAGAAQVLEVFADEETKKRYLTKFYAGEWTCSMCLTEPQAGSDLGLITTKAEPLGDGKYAVTGNKIFITGGKHDLVDNICHLVLARLPDAPEGIDGISLFMVSEKKLDGDQATAENNGVACTGIEHKMGIKGSATCAMSFNGAEAVLIGQPNKGMDAMFVMMNDERLNVAMQGLTLAEIAFQNAALYADQRVQGKKMTERVMEKFTGKAAAPATIIQHANVRKDLIDMKSQIDGWRALAYETAVQLDISKRHPDEAARKEAHKFVSLMTPVLKACVSDLGCASAQRGVQLHGGMGYITETGVEQYYRDALIATIYEGTNDIQSMDFAFRKSGHLGKIAQTMGAEITGLMMKNPALAAQAPAMMQAVKIFQETAQNLMGKAEEAKKGKVEALDDVLVHARDFMDMFGQLAVGAMWVKMMDKASGPAAAEPLSQSFFKTKMDLGHHYINSVMLPQMKALGTRIKAGADTVRRIPPSALLPQ